MWGVSSAGRAPVLHAGGQEFDPPTLHHFKNSEHFLEESVLFFLPHYGIIIMQVDIPFFVKTRRLAFYMERERRTMKI